MAANVRPDLAIDSLELAKKQKKASLKDLRSINRIIKKIYEKENKVVFRKIGNDKDLCVASVSDASYNTEDHSIAGEIILLGNKEMNNVFQYIGDQELLDKFVLLQRCGDKSCNENC